MRLIPLAASVFIGLLAGCQGRETVRIEPRADATPLDAATVADRDPRALKVFDGRTGEAIDWSDMIASLDSADVIILGEQHDDGVGHATQLAITQDVAARRVGEKPGALSLEMLERDEQMLVDDWQEGLIDTASFAKLTESESWAGEDSWKNWYQPVINAAHDAGWRIVAGNAPRRYVRLARSKGYDFLNALPPSRRALFDVPETWPLDYRQRFVDIMAGEGDDDEDEGASTQPTTAPAAPAAEPTTTPATQPASQPAVPAHGPMKPEDVDSALRSQLLWDATMGDSIAKARRGGAKPVIHLVGQFHCDFNGGTVQETRARLGRGVRIVTVSTQRRERDTLHDRDLDRADFVIYTGRRPPKKEEPEAATQPQTQPDETKGK